MAGLDGVSVVLALMLGYMNAYLGCIAGPLRGQEIGEGGRRSVELLVDSMRKSGLEGQEYVGPWLCSRE
jgi:hypothetical protein